MYLQRTKQIIQIVDNKRYLIAALLLTNLTAEHIWRQFIFCWASLYTGYPDKLNSDQGSDFTQKPS